MKKAAKLGELGLGKSRARPGEKSSKGVAVDKQERGKRFEKSNCDQGFSSIFSAFLSKKKWMLAQMGRKINIILWLNITMSSERNN